VIWSILCEAASRGPSALADTLVWQNLGICINSAEYRVAFKNGLQCRHSDSAYLIKYLKKYWTDLHQRFRFGTCIYGDYETDIILAVVQVTLLW